MILIINVHHLLAGEQVEFGVHAQSICAENNPSINMECRSIWGEWAKVIRRYGRM